MTSAIWGQLPLEEPTRPLCFSYKAPPRKGCMALQTSVQPGHASSHTETTRSHKEPNDTSSVEGPQKDGHEGKAGEPGRPCYSRSPGYLLPAPTSEFVEVHPTASICFCGPPKRPRGGALTWLDSDISHQQANNFRETGSSHSLGKTKPLQQGCRGGAHTQG